MMEKMVRQLEDLVNSETSIIRKVGQMEAENINLNFKLLDKQLPDILSNSEKNLELATSLHDEFQEGPGLSGIFSAPCFSFSKDFQRI